MEVADVVVVVTAVAVTNRNLLRFVLTTTVHGNSNIKDVYTSSSYKGFVRDIIWGYDDECW